MSEKTVHCPKCGSEDIRERNVAFASLPVTSWEFDDGDLRPADYDTDVAVDWETADAPRQYVCDDCGSEYGLDQLEIRAGTAQSEETPTP